MRFMSTLLTFVTKGPIIHPDQPRSASPEWLASIHRAQTENYVRFLEHRQKKIQALMKNLLLYGQGPLNTSFPEDPTTLLNKTLSILRPRRDHIAQKLFSTYTKFPPEPLSQQLKPFFEPTTVHPIQTLQKLWDSERLSMQSTETVRKQCEEAITYLYPRKLSLDPQLHDKNIEMPQHTSRFMLAAFNNAKPTKKMLPVSSSFNALYKIKLSTTSYILKQKPTLNPTTPQEDKKLQIAQTLFMQEQINNLLFSTKSLYITNLLAMREHELIFEYLEGKDLFEAFTNPEIHIQPQQFQQFCQTVISGLLEIERGGFCHADIKPENIFLNKNLTNAKLGDLGFAHPVSEIHHRGSFTYAAPEILQGKVGSSISSDVFAFGIILFIYLFKNTPEHLLYPYANWDGDNDTRIIHTTRALDPSCHALETIIHKKLNEKTSSINQLDPNQLFRNLAKRCLAIDPKHRPSLNEIQELLAPPIPTHDPQGPIISTLRRWMKSWSF